LFKASNDCEIAVLGSLLPLFTLVLADGARLREWAKPAQLPADPGRRPAVHRLLDLPACACRGWQADHPVDGAPARALLAFGLLLNIACAMILVHCGVRLQRWRLLLWRRC
jgi:hypothetical protein